MKKGHILKKKDIRKVNASDDFKYKKRDIPRILGYGFIMGIADIIPGVSGATIALILNYYENLINAFHHVIKNLFSKKLFSKQLAFLINLYIGVFIGMVFLGSVILKVLEVNKSIIYSFFVGVIIASIILLISQNYEKLKTHLMWLIAGFIIAYFALDIQVNMSHGIFNLFISGFLAIIAMLLPGISGSYVLVMLGQYEHVLNLIKNLDTKITFFVIGIILGLATGTKFIKYLITRYHNSTLSFLIGVMIAGLKTPLKEVKTYDVFVILVFLIGALVVFILHILSTHQKRKVHKK